MSSLFLCQVFGEGVARDGNVRNRTLRTGGRPKNESLPAKDQVAAFTKTEFKTKHGLPGLNCDLSPSRSVQSCLLELNATKPPKLIEASSLQDQCVVSTVRH